jgi:hypothetical protein
MTGENFVTVSRDIFFATVGQMNVHPRAERDASFWETPSRQLMGISTPGYLGTGEKTWRVCRSLAGKQVKA